MTCWMPSGAVFASSAGLFEVSVTFLETVVVEIVMTVVVVVLCAELSTTGGATVTRLWWPESAWIQFGCSGMGVVCAALLVSEVTLVSELVRSRLVWGAGSERQSGQARPLFARALLTRDLCVFLVWT